MSLSRDVAWRYLKHPSDPLLSVVGMVSTVGLVIGVMALVISMALMTGYRDDLERKLLGGNAEIFVFSSGDPEVDLRADLAPIRAAAGVADAHPAILQHALATSENGGDGEQVMVKGIDGRDRPQTSMLGRVLGPTGRLVTEEGTQGVAIGKHLARKLKAEIGSPIVLTVPSSERGRIFPRTGLFTVTNVFATGFHEFDSRWVFVEIGSAAGLLGTQNPVNLVEVSTTKGSSLDTVKRAIASVTGERHAMTDWREMNQSLFSLLTLQQRILFIVIGLIVFVSTFNIVSALVTTIHEKRKEIAILISMGASRKLIRRIFIWYGTMVGVAGTAIGVALGVAVCWIITRYELVSFGPEIAEVYFVSSIPFITKWRDLAIISGFAISVSFLATVLPSMRAARVTPAEALRHE